jgi:hypothetical protein
MDGHEKQFVAMFDSDFEAEQHNALTLLRQYQQKAGRSCRGMVAEVEQLQDGARNHAAQLEQYKAAVAKWKQQGEAQARTIAGLRRAILRLDELGQWIGSNRKRLLAGAAVVALAGIGYNFFGPQTWPSAVAERAAVDKALHDLADGAKWGPGESEPRVYPLAGKPHWVIFGAEIDRGSHADAQGKTVDMKCIHLYAKPAVADYGVYLKPAARNSFVGWFAWPERTVSCKAASVEKADSK